MKKFKIENILNQRKLLTHLSIILLSLVIVILNILISSDSKTFERFLNGFILILIQMELFIFMAHIIFKNMNTGTTPGEITRIVLTRFAFFLIACFIAAFIIIIIFHYVRQLLIGGDPGKVVYNFFSFEFRTWFKATIFGLLLGAVIFIIVLWQDALKSEQKLREENLIFQNETLKNQVNPHFLFNSLNTLSALVNTQPDVAEEFINRLSSIYRYILENSSKDRVPLGVELSFIRDYFFLHKIRDDGKIQLEVKVNETDNSEILPVSLQILVENAIKHNKATRESPLKISIYIENKHVIVKNNLQKMAVQLKSTKIGLKNLAQRVRIMTGKALIIEETNTDFVVKIPLL